MHDYHAKYHNPFLHDNKPKFEIENTSYKKEWFTRNYKGIHHKFRIDRIDFRRLNYNWSLKRKCINKKRT